MEERPVTHNTFAIERTYPAAPARVYAAFADPVKKRRWFVEGGGSAVEEFAMDFREGGSEYALYRFQEGSPFPGSTYSTDSVYQNIVPDQRVVLTYATTFGGRRISACLVTIEFRPEEQGTKLIVTHQGAFFEPSDGPQMREQGWRTLLDRLPKELSPGA
jgi:uncharacterized protein YndB with AHSA1/START domain